MKWKVPYQFRGFISRDKLNDYIMGRKVKFIPLRRVNMYLGKGSLQGFSSIYSNILQAMSDFDYDYLSEIMEPRLYEHCKTGLEQIQNKNYKLEYIEQNLEEAEASESEDEGDVTKDSKKEEDAKDKDSSKDKKFMGFTVDDGAMGEILSGPLGFVYGQKDMQIYIEARGAFGVNIKRSKNKDSRRVFGNDFTSMAFYKGDKLSWGDMIRKQVLILDVYYYTSRKLALKDEEGDLVEGSDNPKDLYDHKFRFETYTDKIDWVLTDMDEKLQGNPFLPSEHTEDSETQQE